MDTIAKNFITKFHTLPGETVKDKHQNLFHLLHEHQSILTNARDLEFITLNLIPKNHLEKIFRTDFLIYFKQFARLYEDFKKEDEITVKKLAKHDWFFEQAFNELNCEEFVNVLLPTTSYSLKAKILKKLPVENERADEFFDAVCKRYGIFLSTILLPKCTDNKIRETLTKHPVQFTVAQLKLIFKKSPDLVKIYLEERSKHEGTKDFSKLDSFFQYVAQKNPEMFSEIFEKYEIKVCLGRRTTKRLINSQKTAISNKTEDYLKVLNKSVTVRKMGAQVKEIFFKTDPTEYQKEYWESLLKFYPKNQQFNIFKATYNNFYHLKLGEDSDVSENILKVIENSEQREKLTKQKMEKEGNVNFLQYMTSQHCIQEMMEKLNHSSVDERSKYIKIAVNCCFLNKDYASLLKICELVAIRLKNDDSTIRLQFLFGLTENEKNLKFLDEKHWKFVFDIIVAVRVKREFYFGEDILPEYLKYLAENNKCIKDVVRKDFDWINILRYTSVKKHAKANRLLLEELIATDLKERQPDSDKDEQATFDCKLLTLCRNYNKHNPNDIITTMFDNPRIMKSVQHVLETDDPGDFSENLGLQYFVCRPLEELQQIKVLYFKNFKTRGCSKGLMWFLKYEPKTLQDNFDQFLCSFADGRGLNSNNLWRYIKKCTYLDFDRKTIEFCKQKLLEDGYEHKIGLVKALTMLDNSDAHLEFIKLFMPTVEKVDLSDDEAAKKYLLQSKIVRFLHYLKSPKDVLEATFDFCKGDYLKPALAPLYSCLYKLPENETKFFIEKLDNIKAVSVKKHAVHLSCIIYNVETVHKQLTNTTGPVTIPITRFFAKNPSDNLWQILERQINRLEKNEIQVLKRAFKINIPFNYKRKCVETVWKILDKHDNKELKKLLLSKIDEKTIQTFNSQFAFEIIKSTLFKDEESSDSIAKIFIYLDCNEKFVLLSDVLNNFKKNYWDDPEFQSSTRKNLNAFVLSLLSMRGEETNEKFVSELTTAFTSVFSYSEALEETVIIKCINLNEEKVDHSSKILLEINRTLCGKYGLFAMHLFTETVVKHIFKHVFANDCDRIELCYSLFKVKERDIDCLLILQLLPKPKPKSKKHFPLYEEILRYVSQINDSLVQLQYNLYLKSD